MSTSTLETFIDWFCSGGGSIDQSALGFEIFSASDGGRGVIALTDIPKEHILFKIPRSLVLSTRTSSLPARFGAKSWKNMKMDEGWTGLILCMMWEAANGLSSKWSQYFAVLPTQFNTPMFWSQDELIELDGTSVVDKLGRTEAEQSYIEKLLPAIKSRPDIFPPEKIPSYYSLETYHLMGSRILSRSFDVERWSSEEAEQNEQTSDSREDGMDVDSADASDANELQSDEAEEQELEDENDDSSDPAMVPMADMLNARYGSENAKLFYDEHELRMVSIKPIRAGEQIWNTYGDLPNSELLRRYGHVDLLPLPRGGEGNPGDVAEIRADIVVSVVTQHHSSSSESLQARIEWWLEEGGDDVFVLESDLELPPSFISFIRLLVIDSGEWEEAKEKERPPKAKFDALVLNILHDVLQKRLEVYPTSLQMDEAMLCGQTSPNKRKAIIVRIGEKRILHDMIAKVDSIRQKGDSKNKRKGKSSGDKETMSSKRARK